MIGAGAGIFGNIEIGARSKIGAGSVVLDNVPAQCTAAGVPARLVGLCANREPAQEMDQSFQKD
jgi:serine O-acetyltransferase